MTNPMTTIHAIAEMYPRLFHMAAGGSWSSIEQYGLLSTSALLDLFEITGEERLRVEAQRRPQTVPLFHQAHGTVSIRDQKVLSEKKLVPKLTDGLTAEEWYRLLNSKVFFWVTERRLEVLLNARAYRQTQRLILEVDTESLLNAYANRVEFCAMNSGNTSPYAHPRGIRTFLPLTEYPFDDRLRKRQEPLVEVVIDRGVPDVREYVLAVTELSPEGVRNRLL